MHDILIIGGGVNGCGIARDAVGRGLSVALFEQGDLASGTSSASTKLIHGGLRYLQYFEFRLVREALAERENLLRIAPHIIWPMRFVLPCHPGLRPAWQLRLGLFIYDHIGGRKLLPATKTLDLRRDEAGAPLKSRDTRGFEYSDCWVDDARLVVLNAMDAAAKGALIETRARVVKAARAQGHWNVRVEKNGATRTLQARVIINASGPRAADVLRDVFGTRADTQLRIVKGSHIVVPKLFEHGRSYIFQNADGRIVFAIPYETDFTLIGTTDLDWQGPVGDMRAGEEEISYLCAAVNEYFTRQISPADVVWSYAGARPLRDDGASKAQAATRDYTFALDAGEAGDQPALLTIFGGKITTYRRMAERALDRLAPFLPKATAAPWTANAPLPGGDFPVEGFGALVARLLTQHPWLEPAHAHRLARAYGTRAFVLLSSATNIAALGICFGADLFEAEARYLVTHEWAQTADDILWRRTKCGLQLNADQALRLDEWMRATFRA